ncbi:hypothetical protein [Kribbella sp. NPDC048915]|uniref:hypothetical protein n=1 Tax=Kribbella sp. NPDC048915 TaxID=3155148 RepID=UPI0033E704C9
MPLLFAFCAGVLDAPTIATFAAFGSFAMLLLVDFQGPRVQRLRAQAQLALASLVLVALGTVAGQALWSAIVATAVVAFVVLFSGVVSSVLAGAGTSLLLAFILSVATPTPLSALPDRLAGIAIAGVAAVLAVWWLWPSPWKDPLAAPAARVCRTAAAQLRSEAADPIEVGAARSGRTAVMIDELRRTFTATPYRPTSLSTGLSLIVVRIEDIALGCAVSLVVGLLFWPRGATTALGKALAEAYVDSAQYLVNAVGYAVACCGPGPAAPQDGRRAAAAAPRLDDTFRTYLTERGAKPVPLSDMTSLVTGVVAIRLAADAVLELWERYADGRPPTDERAAAQAALMTAADRLRGWYTTLATSLDGIGPVPEPLDADHATKNRLVEVVRRDLNDRHGNATPTAIRILWTHSHLEALRRLQPDLATAAGRTTSNGSPVAAGELSSPAG